MDRATATERKERLRLWVAALRSGEFRQGSNQLTTTLGTFCCLGVACEVAMRNGIENLTFQGPGFGYEQPGCTAENSELPDAVADWYGLSDWDPVVAASDPDSPDKPLHAAGANDGLGWTFRRIADAIEQHYALNDPVGQSAFETHSGSAKEGE